MTLDEAITPDPEPVPPGTAGLEGDWLPLCILEVTTGTLWAGDPHAPLDAENGLLADLPAGLYRVDGKVLEYGPETRVVSRLRVCRQELDDTMPGRALGRVATDSPRIALGDLRAFESAYDGDLGRVRADIGRQIDRPWGIVLAPEPAATLVFLPPGLGPADAPAVELIDPDGDRIGIELEFLAADAAWP